MQVLLQEERLVYQPTLVHLEHCMNLLTSDIYSATKAVGRIRAQSYDTASHTALPSGEVLGEAVDERHRKPYYDIIMEDTDILQIVRQVQWAVCSAY